MSRERAQAWLTKQLNIDFPYVSMGKVDSLDLFGANELMILAFYAHNQDRYGRVLDIGANLGLHSIIMERQGWWVRGFEPDPETFAHYEQNALAYLNQHSGGHIDYTQAAVSDHDGEAQFTRILNNRTGSCLVGSNKEPYGPTETFSVPVVDCRPLFDWADLAKLDVEGHEGILLRCVTAEHLTHLDLICELRGDREAASVLKHFSDLDCPIYTQKNDWKPATCMAHMPVKHTEGSIFISKRGGPWE